MTDPRCRLYLLTPPAFEPAKFIDPLQRALDAGDVACVQLRLKDADDAEFLRAAEVLKPVVKAAGAAFIVNDRPLIAAAIDADGVHVGQSDVPYTDARAAVGGDRFVGVTCHNSRHLAIEASEAGADYVAFGAFYPTTTKVVTARAAPDLIRWWSEMMVVPSVAIGGITVENAPELIDAGADFLAVASGVWEHAQGPAEAVRQFNAAMERASEKRQAA